MDFTDLASWHFDGISAELSMLLLATVLGMLQLAVAARAGNSQRGLRWNVGARDEEAPPISKGAARLERARRNFMETYPFFVALEVAGALIDRHNWSTIVGSQVYLAGRVIYVPLYALGVPVLRTLVWLIASIGIVLVLLGVLLPGWFA
ncbi:MAG: MAPEG family protein [Alphaproteobacteria bacterium]